MSKDVKSLPGEGIGWGEEEEAGRARRAELSVRGVSVTSVLPNAAKLSSALVPELQMNCSRKMCRKDEEGTSSGRIVSRLAMEPEGENTRALKD